MLSLSEIAIDVPDPTMNGTENATTDGATILGDMQVNHEVITEVVAARGSSYFLTSSGHVYATGKFVCSQHYLKVFASIDCCDLDYIVCVQLAYDRHS